MSNREFVVIDSDLAISWSRKTDSAESFSTYAAAEKRAKALAESEPGTVVGIYQLVAETTAPVEKPVTKRRE